jgi:ferritin-like metal-binding protein YciE
MSLNTMEDLLVGQLTDLYGAVRQCTKVLPRMVEAAANERLADAFRQHLLQTRDQIARLEQIFQVLGAHPRGRHCAGMAGLLQEVGERLKRGGNQALIDAGLITDARRVKHYEIAAYTSTIALAETLGLGSIVRLLTFTLREETAADERLSRIAKNEVNPDGARVGAEVEA